MNLFSPVFSGLNSWTTGVLIVLKAQPVHAFSPCDSFVEILGSMRLAFKFINDVTSTLVGVRSPWFLSVESEQ